MAKNDFFLEKYTRKMRGSTFSTARGWVDGIGELTPSEKKRLLIRIKHKHFI